MDPNKNYNSLKRQAESKSFKSTREDKGKPALFIDTQGNQVMVYKMQLNIIRTIREEERSKTTPRRKQEVREQLNRDKNEL